MAQAQLSLDLDIDDTPAVPVVVTPGMTQAEALAAVRRVFDAAAPPQTDAA